MPPSRAGSATASIKAEGRVTLHPGRVANVLVTADQSELRADGRSDVALRVEATDSKGNRVLDTRLKGAAEGSVGDLTDADGDGVFEATYTSPVRYEPATDTVVIRDDSSDASGRFALGLRPSRRALSLGAKLGYSTNLAGLSAPVFLAEANLKLPILEQATHLGAELGFMGRKLERQLVESADTVRLLIFAVPLMARAGYRHSVSPWLDVYLGAGGGICVVRAEMRSRLGQPTKTTSVSLAYGMQLGGDVGVGPGRIRSEIQYSHANVGEPGIRGGVAGLSLLAGYSLEL